MYLLYSTSEKNKKNIEERVYVYCTEIYIFNITGVPSPEKGTSAFSKGRDNEIFNRFFTNRALPSCLLGI